MIAVRFLTAVVLAASSSPSARSAPSSTPMTRPASRPTSAPAGGDHIVIYRPGVGINWTRRQVELTGKVALREGELELFACATDVYGGDKTHESIMWVEARPLHVYQALGLIGLEPGKPAQYDAKANRMLPATGQPLELLVEWLDDGRRRQVDVSAWMQHIKAPAKPLGPLPWVFAGSAPRSEGGILADEDGTVATVVDFDGSIVCLSANHPRDYDRLWVAARPEAVPHLDMPCTLIIRAAGLRIELDRFGRVSVAGRRVGPDELVEAVKRYLKATPKGAVHVLVAPTALKADVRTLRERLRAAGAPDSAIQIQRQPETAFPDDDPEAGKAFLKNQLPLQRSLLDSARQEHRRLIEQLTSRRSALQQRAAAVTDYIARVRSGLTNLAGDSDVRTGSGVKSDDEHAGPEAPTTRATSRPASDRKR